MIVRGRRHAVDPTHFGQHNPTFVCKMIPVVRFGIDRFYRYHYYRTRDPNPVGSHSRKNRCSNLRVLPMVLLMVLLMP